MRGIIRTLTAQGADVVTVRIDTPLRFKPGQAVQIQFPGDVKKRFISASSSPTEGQFLELTIQYQTGHPLGDALKNAKRGDEVEMEGPHGVVFTLPDPVPTRLILIAAGIGIAPFRSVIKSILDTQLTTELWLFHCVQRSSDLIFKSDFAEWSGAKKHFHYSPSITNDKDQSWNNEVQKVGEMFTEKHIDLAPASFMLCGVPEFVKEMDAQLKTVFKIDPTRIRKEQW